MSTVLLAPHNDDETLFAAYSCLALRPLVVVCLRSELQERRGGPNAAVREAETHAAMAILGCPWEQWAFSDAERVPRNTLEIWMRNLLAKHETVIAPAVHEGGHEHHNLIGELALEVWGSPWVFPYTTYIRGRGRIAGLRPVNPEPDWVVKKHLALACYRSQIENRNTRDWFTGDLAEWYA